MLLRRQGKDRVGPQLSKVIDLSAQASRGAIEHGRRQHLAIVGAHEIAQRAGTVELAVGHARIGRSLGPEARAKMLEVVEPVEQEPGSESFVFAHQRPGGGDSAPHDGAAVGLRPHGDDPGCRVPAP